jgi:polysaccharide deacetylase family protein (PEP-CTERM system associated)
MINALCVDLEHWWCSEFLSSYLPDDREDQVVESTMPILDLLDKYDMKATFFVLGIVAEEHPDLVRIIYEKGHEIASQAYSHKRLHHLSDDEVRDEVEKSVNVLEAITGEKPLGFRAPSFSMDNSTKQALEVLMQYGFKYDASVFPVKTNLYGEPRAPRYPYRPALHDLTETDESRGIIEFPMSVLKLGVNIPVAGGFYFRVLPLWFFKLAFKWINRTNPAIFYIHPWETYPHIPRLTGLPRSSRFVHYHGIESALGKFEGLLREFEFAPVREVLALHPSRPKPSLAKEATMHTLDNEEVSVSRDRFSRLPN